MYAWISSIDATSSTTSNRSKCRKMNHFTRLTSAGLMAPDRRGMAGGWSRVVGSAAATRAVLWTSLLGSVSPAGGGTRLEVRSLAAPPRISDLAPRTSDRAPRTSPLTLRTPVAAKSQRQPYVRGPRSTATLYPLPAHALAPDPHCGAFRGVHRRVARVSACPDACSRRGRARHREEEGSSACRSTHGE